MIKIFAMKLDQIQPSQLFISSEKLAHIMKTFNPANLTSLEAIPVKKLGNQVVFVDGHTRAFAAFLHGLPEVPVYWEDDEEELNWDAYEICVDWCKNEGIHTIADLKNRVISEEQYKTLWLGRCERMLKDLEADKNRKPNNVKP